MAGRDADPEGDEEGEGVTAPPKGAGILSEAALAAAMAIMGSDGGIRPPPDWCMCMALAAAMATIDCWKWAAAK